MQSMRELVSRANSLNAAGLSWGEVAAEMYPNQDREKTRAVLFRIVREGYYPHKNDLRERLDLPPMKIVEACPHCGEVHITRCPYVDKSEIPTHTNTTVVVVVGESSVPPGAQVVQAELCECGQWFISNHPRRKKCFVCSPFRRKRKERVL